MSLFRKSDLELRVEDLEGEAKSLRELFDKKQNTTIPVNASGEQTPSYSPYFAGYEFRTPVYVNLEEVLHLILDHLGLEVKRIPASSPSVELVKKPKK